MRRRGGAYVSSAPGAFTRVEAGDWAATAAASTHDPARSLAPPEPDMPVDVVYTWVDGSDPAWRARRDEARRRIAEDAAAPLDAGGLDDPRFVDSDELRHFLRSVHQFANWVRTIHLVTDGQVPSWLRTDHPRIRVVDHRKILGGSRFSPPTCRSTPARHRPMICRSWPPRRTVAT